MSKLDEILKDGELGRNWQKRQIQKLIQELVDETFDKDDEKAYEFWQKVEAL